jgi:hypothetical protein
VGREIARTLAGRVHWLIRPSVGRFPLVQFTLLNGQLINSMQARSKLVLKNQHHLKVLIWLHYSIPNHSQETSEDNRYRWRQTIPLASYKCCSGNQNEPRLIFERASLLRLRGEQTYLPKPIHRSIDQPYGPTCNTSEERVEPRFCPHFGPKREESVLDDLAREEDTDEPEYCAQCGIRWACQGPEINRNILI